jgi:parvulin-like peptidyl-prolyl isomerase
MLRVTPLKAISFVSLSAALLSSCSLSQYAAKVNGQVITQGQLVSELKDVASNKPFVAQIEKSQGSIYGSGAGTFSSAFTAEILNRRISVTLIQQALKKLHLPVSQSALAVAYPEAAAGFGGATVFAGFPKNYQAQLVNDTAAIDTLEAHLVGKSLSPTAVNNYYNQHLGAFTEYCSSDILVTTQSAAASIAKQVAAGSSFASLAQKDSKDTNTASNGGALGCGLLSQYSQAFGPSFAQEVSSLGVNQVSSPFQGSQGWYLIEVTSKPVVPETQAVPNIVTQLLGSAAPTKLADYVQSFAKASQVEVNPSYGRLSLANGQVSVLPPSAPSAAAQKAFFATPS